MTGQKQTPTRDSGEPPLDIAGAAQYLNVGERFVRRLVAEHRINYLKVGKFVRFERRELDAFLRRSRVDRQERNQQP